MKKALALLSLSCAIAYAAPDGKALFKQCAICHGEQAQKRSLDVSAVIAGMDAKEIVKTLKSYQSGELNQYGFGQMMQGQATRLTEAEMQAVAVYVASLTPAKALELPQPVTQENNLSEEKRNYNSFIQAYFKANPNATFSEAKQKWEAQQAKTH